MERKKEKKDLRDNSFSVNDSPERQGPKENWSHYSAYKILPWVIVFPLPGLPAVASKSRGVSWPGGTKMLEQREADHRGGTEVLDAGLDHSLCSLGFLLRALFHLDFTEPLNMSHMGMLFRTLFFGYLWMSSCCKATLFISFLRPV